MRKALTFDDVLIVPKFSTIESRKDVDLSFNNLNFPSVSLPIISSNMDTVTESNMARTMISYGAQACLHRFQTIDQNVQMFLDSGIKGFANNLSTVPMVSIGLGYKEFDRAKALFEVNAFSFVIDVANGASLSVVNQVKGLREIIGSNGSIIVGNFATGDSVKEFLEHTGDIVDGVKVGIGGGSACTTRIKTGCGYPQLDSIIDVASVLENTGITVIADGGIRSPGDVAKALGAGADLCMIGGMFAGTDESPGELVNNEGKVLQFLKNGTVSVNDWITHPSNVKVFKKYRGSASKESYDVQGKDASWRTDEGESFLVPYKGSVKSVLQDIEGGLRSAMSYVGARNLKEFYSRCEFVKVSSSTVKENYAHGKT